MLCDVPRKPGLPPGRVCLELIPAQLSLVLSVGHVRFTDLVRPAVLLVLTSITAKRASDPGSRPQGPNQVRVRGTHGPSLGLQLFLCE